MAKITWTNKTALNPQPSISRENKCTDADLNEIKSVVNINDDNVGDITTLTTTDKSSVVNAINEIEAGNVYSTNETNTGKIWINNEPIYRKVVEITSLTIGGAYYSLDMTNQNIIDYQPFLIIDNSSTTQIETPFYNNADDRFRCLIIQSSNQIFYNIGSGNSGATKVRIIIEYTKTTD